MINQYVISPSQSGGIQVFFSVSTDKAANPVNLMGASKRLMQHVIFSGAASSGSAVRTTSARFANVAFSDGSLLHSWIRRLEKRQPLSVPQHTRRFFISLQEAGKICLIAAACAPDRHFLIPRLSPASDLHELQSIAEDYLRYHGYAPRFYENEIEARANIESDIPSAKYPLLLTPLDTSGEKSYEEFVGEGEHVIETGLADLLAVQYRPGVRENILEFLSTASKWVVDPLVSIAKNEIISDISSVIPELIHRESKKHLDERM